MISLQEANLARITPMLTTVQSATGPTIRRSVLVLVAGLRRLLNGWVAAAIACRETAALLAKRHLDDREPKHIRHYGGRSMTPLENVASSAGGGARGRPEQNHCQTSA